MWFQCSAPYFLKGVASDYCKYKRKSGFPIKYYNGIKPCIFSVNSRQLFIEKILHRVYLVHTSIPRKLEFLRIGELESWCWNTKQKVWEILNFNQHIKTWTLNFINRLYRFCLTLVKHCYLLQKRIVRILKVLTIVIFPTLTFLKPWSQGHHLEWVA